MSLHTKKEFATLCGLTTNKLSVYHSRNKFLLTGDLIDDTLPQNKEFLIYHSEKNRGKLAAQRPEKNTPSAITSVSTDQFDELFEKLSSKIPYDKTCEKEFTELMISQTKSEKEFPVVHLSMALDCLLEGLIQIGESAIKREAQLYKNLMDKSASNIQGSGNYYFNKIETTYFSAMESMNQLVLDIISDYQNNTKKIV